AKEGMFFRSVARLNRHHVPVNSLLFQGVWACVLVLSGSFDELTNRIIFAVFIYYGATAFGVFVLRYKMPDAHRPYKVWGYPVVPGIVVLFCIALFISTIQTSPRDAAIGLVLILTGIPMYWWFVKKKK
ncbi:MAG: APC family permease, partial [Flavisolibacter sp.]